MLLVLLQRHRRRPARPEPVALVRSAQPVIRGATARRRPKCEQLAIDLDGEQDRSRPKIVRRAPPHVRKPRRSHAPKCAVIGLSRSGILCAWTNSSLSRSAMTVDDKSRCMFRRRRPKQLCSQAMVKCLPSGAPTWRRSDGPSTLIVGVHSRPEEAVRLSEYSPTLDPDRFAAHERFVMRDVSDWVGSHFRFTSAAPTTAVFGVSAGGELALALGLRHPDVFGAILCASPGAGYRPPELIPDPIPRTYFVAGTEEPFFHDNATRWASALRDAGAEVVMTERPGSHGDALARRVPHDGAMGLRSMTLCDCPSARCR